MITGDTLSKIKCYYFIDRLAEGLVGVFPNGGEEIWGHPYQWHSEQSCPFIVHMMNGKITKTVNVSDVSIIEFE